MMLGDPFASPSTPSGSSSKPSAINQIPRPLLHPLRQRRSPPTPSAPRSSSWTPFNVDFTDFEISNRRSDPRYLTSDERSQPPPLQQSNHRILPLQQGSDELSPTPSTPRTTSELQVRLSDPILISVVKSKVEISIPSTRSSSPLRRFGLDPITEQRQYHI